MIEMFCKIHKWLWILENNRNLDASWAIPQAYTSARPGFLANYQKVVAFDKTVIFTNWLNNFWPSNLAVFSGLEKLKMLQKCFLELIPVFNEDKVHWFNIHLTFLSFIKYFINTDAYFHCFAFFKCCFLFPFSTVIAKCFLFLFWVSIPYSTAEIWTCWAFIWNIYLKILLF